MEPGPAQVRIGDALAIGVAPSDTDSDSDPDTEESFAPLQGAGFNWDVDPG